MVQKPTKSDSLTILKALLLLLTIIAGWLFLRQSALGDNLRDYDWVRLQVLESGASGLLFFIIVIGATTVIGFPRILLSTIAGYVFGLLAGFFIALAGTVFGCVLSFYYARFLGRSIIENKMTDRLHQFEKKLTRHGFLVSILVRLLPVGNNSITNLLAGVSSVRPPQYFIGSTIGYIPLTFIFVLVGNGVQQDLADRVWLSVGLFTIALLPIGYFIQQKLFTFRS